MDFITRQSEHGVVYVHCKVGYSRTAAVAGAYLIAAGLAATADEAVAALKRARPPSSFAREAYAALAEFSGVWAVEQGSRSLPVA